VLSSLLFSVAAFATGSTIQVSDAMSASQIEYDIQAVLDSSMPGDTVRVVGVKINETATLNLTIPAEVTVVWNAETEGLNFNNLGEGSFVYAPSAKPVLPAIEEPGSLPPDESQPENPENEPEALPVENEAVQPGESGESPLESLSAVNGTDETDTKDLVAQNASAESDDQGLADPDDQGIVALGLMPVSLVQTGASFQTLAEAVTAASTAGINTYTLEISDDVTESGNLVISADVTIIGVSGQHTVSTGLTIFVRNGGKLTLGNGSNTDGVTFSYANIRVLDGSIITYDGVTVDCSSSSYGALHLEGSNVNAAIYGGTFRGKTALDVAGGAHVSVISGGSFYGTQDAVHVTDANTRIALISGGSFYQTEVEQTLHGHAFFLQDYATIGRITGGHFESVDNCAMVVIRGAWIDEISGGTFKVNRIGTISDNSRNAVLVIESENNQTGITLISGGSFNGGSFGILVINYYSSYAGAQIGTISGGTFNSKIGVQNDVNGTIGLISGGNFNGTEYGLMNVGKITTITDPVVITGKYAGIWNYYGSRIDEISGGTFSDTGTSGVAISNAGTIDIISGGTFIGNFHAIDNSALNPGRLNTISGGIFWAKLSTTITLKYDLQLEPGLSADIGFGRYQSGNGDIFNNESLVKYPGSYFMSSSTDTLSNPAVSGTKFRYLRQTDYLLTVNGSYAANTGAGRYIQGRSVTINAGTRAGYAFAGWTTADGVVFTDSLASQSGFVMPAKDVTVTANWTVANYAVTVYGSYADNSGAGFYNYLDHVSIDAGSREGYSFAGWTINTNNAVLSNTADAQSSFDMPAADVVLTAGWLPINYQVIVHDSYATDSGTGIYNMNDQVVINAGIRDGYIFSGWTVNVPAPAGNGNPPSSLAVNLDDASANTTGFVMPATNVVLTANWVEAPAIITFTVTFIDWNATVLKVEKVAYGADATAPASPSRSNYVFTGWSRTFKNVTSDITVLALYRPITTTVVPPTNPEVPPIKPPTTPPVVPTVPPSTTQPPVNPSEPPSEPAVSTPAESAETATAPEVSVEYNQTPTTVVESGSAWALVNLILCCIGLLLIIPTAVRVMRYKGQNVDEADRTTDQDVERKRNKRALAWLAVTSLAAIASVIVFVLTENMHNPMILVDRWTVVNFLILLVEAIFMDRLYRVTKNDDEEESYASAAPAK
jgi:uncharacterized repeat protein (TIGR02543 family)